MEKHPPILIAFFARGREIGFVALEDGQILRYGVKTIKGKKLEPGLIQHVEGVLVPVLAAIGTHGAIVVERLNSHSPKGALCQALHSLSEQWREQGYQVYPVSWQEVLERLCEGEKATQREIIKAMVDRQPLLWSLVHEASAPQIAYWRKVLLAAALAEVARQNLEPQP